MNSIVTTQAINPNFGCLKGYNYRKAGFEAKKRLIDYSMGKSKPNLSLLEKVILKFFPKSNLAYRMSGYKANQKFITKG